MSVVRILTGLLVLVSATVAQADELLYRYECDVVPYDPSAGWVIANACEQACSESLEPGHFVMTWPGAEAAGRLAYYSLLIAGSSQTLPPPPPPFWAECRYASNNALGPVQYSDDGQFVFDYGRILEAFNLYGDAILSQDGGTYVRGLELNAFRTYRIETQDGVTYCFWYDGKLLTCNADSSSETVSYLQIQGSGGFYPPTPSTPPFIINRWDYVRYGRITDGEAIVASDPPGGVLNAGQYSNLDRFTVTFDQPNYVKIDDVTVDVVATKPQSHEATKADGETSNNRNVATETLDILDSTFDIPIVIATRRQDNGPPETVEIVLDRPMSVGVTTRFTFNTGGTPNTVEYTLAEIGACCLTSDDCVDASESDCTLQGGSFKPMASCSTPAGCCLPGGLCTVIDPVCCELSSGTLANRSLSLRGFAPWGAAPSSVACSVAALRDTPLSGLRDDRPIPPLARGEAHCEGDSDADGIDGACGDGCPNDPLKSTPGQCGCGVPDVDTDGDTVADCADQCPGEDDRIDANANGTPDCLEPTIIPTTSTWGLAVLALLLLIAAKTVYRHVKEPLAE